MNATQAAEQKPCEATCAACVCALPQGHESPHLCNCLGSFDGDDRKGDFEVSPIRGPWGAMLPGAENSYEPDLLRWNGSEWEWASDKRVTIRPPGFRLLQMLGYKDT